MSKEIELYFDSIEYIGFIAIYDKCDPSYVLDTETILGDSLIDAQIESENFIKNLKSGLTGKYTLWVRKDRLR